MELSPVVSRCADASLLTLATLVSFHPRHPDLPSLYTAEKAPTAVEPLLVASWHSLRRQECPRYLRCIAYVLTALRTDRSCAALIYTRAGQCNWLQVDHVISRKIVDGMAICTLHRRRS